MKKLFFGGIGVLFAISLVITGCSDPTYKLEPSKVSGPKNLEAITDYDGIVILKWDNVDAASSYQIVRRDEDAKIDLVLSTNVTTNYYVDTVGWTNELVDQKEYKYTVISNPAVATTLQQGSSSVSKVKPTIPAQDAFAPALAAADVEVSRVTSTGGADQIQVKITNKPNLRYQIAYTYGSGTIVRDLESFSITPSSPAWYNTYSFYYLPTFGGKNSVSVKASFNGTYYDATAEATVVADFALSGLPNINNLVAQQYASGTLVTWDDVEGATGYSVYRAKTSSGSNSPVISIYDTPLTVISDWALIPTTALTAPDRTSYDNWRLWVDGTDQTGAYIYAVVATGANNAKSAPAYAYMAPASLNASITSVTPTDDTVEILWTAATGVTYTLAYAEAKDRDSSTSEPTDYRFDAVAAYTPITLTSANYIQGQGVVSHKPAQGKAYVYKLTATQNGVTEEAFKVLASGNFQSLVYFSLQKDTSVANQLAKSVTLTLTNNANYDGRALAIVLYRRATTAGSQVPFTKVADIAYAANSGSVDYTDNNLDVTLTYTYKIEVTGFNLPTTGGVANNVRPNINSSFYLYWSSISVNNTGAAIAHPVGGATGTTFSLPAGGVVLETGYRRVGNGYSDPTAVSENGPNLEGLAFTARYALTAGGNGTTAVTVQKATVTLATTGTGNNAQTTTNYYYYIVLPQATASFSGSLNANFPWSGTNNLGEPIFTNVASF